VFFLQNFDEMKKVKRENFCPTILFEFFWPNFGFKKKCSQHLESDFNLTTYVEFDLY